jgi:hypothetical protein
MNEFIHSSKFIKDKKTGVNKSLYYNVYHQQSNSKSEKNNCLYKKNINLK